MLYFASSINSQLGEQRLVKQKCDTISKAISREAVAIMFIAVSFFNLLFLLSLLQLYLKVSWSEICHKELGFELFSNI